MGKFCCVPGCNNRANRDKFDAKGQTIGYFQFPPDNDPRRAVWIRNIRRDPGPYFSISGTTCVCSMHFEEEYIERLAISTGFRLRLTKEAIPTIFSWNSANGDHFDPSDPQTFPEPDGDDDDDNDTEDANEETNGDDANSQEESFAEGGGEGDEANGASGSNKRKLNKPLNKPNKQMKVEGRNGALKKFNGRSEFATKEESDAEIARLRSTVQIFERKFAEMSRLVNELRSTTIKMLGVMSAGTQQS